MKFIKLFLIPIFCALILLACDTGPRINSYLITGRYSSTASREIEETRLKAGDSIYDELWVVPFYSDGHGFIESEYIFEYMNEPVGIDDGSDFSAIVGGWPDEYNFHTSVLVLVDSSADGINPDSIKIVGIPDSSDLNYLHGINPNKMQDNLDLGTVVSADQNDDIVPTETDLNTAANSFSIDLAVLEELSIIDNALRIISNCIRNYLLHDKQAVTDFHLSQWFDAGINIDSLKTGNEYINSNNYAFNNNYNLSIASNYTNVSSGEKILVDPLGNERTMIAEIYSDEADYYLPFSDQLSAVELSVAGDWLLKDGGEVIALADFSAPITVAADGTMPVGYFPELKLDIGTDNFIKGVFIRWFLKHPDGTVSEADATAVSLALVGAFIQFNEGGLLPDPTTENGEGGTFIVEPGDDYVEWPVSTNIDYLYNLGFRWANYSTMYITEIN